MTVAQLSDELPGPAGSESVLGPLAPDVAGHAGPGQSYVAVAR